MKTINRLLYGDKHFAVFHWLMGLIFMGIVCFSIYLSDIVPIAKMSELVNTDIISLSATIAGFELTSVALLISLSGNQKLQSIQAIGSDKTVYKLFFYSIILLVLSLLIMVVDINVLNTAASNYEVIRNCFRYLSVILFGQGIVFFLSSIRMIAMIFK